MSKYYITENDMSNTASKEQAHEMVALLNEEGFDTEYGASENSVYDSIEDQQAFHFTVNSLMDIFAEHPQECNCPECSI